jgi:hypothetical protein
MCDAACNSLLATTPCSVVCNNSVSGSVCHDDTADEGAVGVGVFGVCAREGITLNPNK